MLQSKRFEMLLNLFILADELESGIIFKKKQSSSKEKILNVMGNPKTARVLFYELLDQKIICDDGCEFKIEKSLLKDLIKREPNYDVFICCLERMGHSVI